jgi:hypothetical protein
MGIIPRLVSDGTDRNLGILDIIIAYIIKRGPLAN